MKKILVLILAILFIAASLSGAAVVSGDENYLGESGDQPRNGVDEDNDNPRDTSDQSPGDRTRFKDS
ncbi:hypothetical protein [Methanomethylovorans sp.]|uniref:hypothetical protein n=1 Tax=Methanomethylovorans sp. TaxID=2758717 RepID=UPI003D096689